LTPNEIFDEEVQRVDPEVGVQDGNLIRYWVSEFKLGLIIPFWGDFLN
jgi:hypothetical protein